MKIITALAVLALTSTAASAQYYGNSNSRGSSYGTTYGTGSNSNSHSVQGHYNNNGTYVQPHVATNPNATQYDNYNARGNYNPNTGAYGTRSPRY